MKKITEKDLQFARSEADKWKRKWEAAQAVIAKLNKLNDENIAYILQLRAEIKSLRGESEGS